MAKVTFTIDDGKLADFTEGFLKMKPIPTSEDGKPLMTEDEWISEWGRRIYFEIYRQGKQRIAEEVAPAVIDKNIIS